MQGGLVQGRNVLSLSWLVLAFIATAWVEHLHWRYFRWPDEFQEQQDREEVLFYLEATANLAENLYSVTSQAGVAYSQANRQAIANSLGTVRQFIQARRPAPAPAIDATPSPLGRWPFNEEGKVRP